MGDSSEFPRGIKINPGRRLTATLIGRVRYLVNIFVIISYNSPRDRA